MHLKKLLFFILLVVGLGSRQEVFSQGRNSDSTIVITDTTNLESLFKRARDLYYNENYGQARRILQKILEKKPNYYEVRTFLGRTYAWEKQYDNARTELSRVLIEKENDHDALSALFDVEFWTESYSVAGDYLKVALGYYPNSTDLLVKKAKLQIRLEEKDEAALTLRRVLDLNPGNKEAIRMMNSLEGRRLNNFIRVGFTADRFKEKDVQQLAVAEYGKYFSFGSLALRGNFADKFGKNGFQYELESYAHVTRITYVDLLFGYSDLTIFPEIKYLAEVYQKLPAGFELSAGFRYLRFTKGTTIYTGSLGNYYKDYYFSVRTFITPKNDIINSVSVSKSSITVIGTIRSYFGDADNYLGIRASRGRSPDETLSLDVATYLPSYSFGAEIQRNAFGRWLMKVDITYSKENINNEDNTSTQRISTGITLKTVF